MAPLPTKDGRVGKTSVGEMGSILLSHPLPIQPNCVDGVRACQESVGRHRGADAVAVRLRFSMVVAAECARVKTLSWPPGTGNKDTFGVVPFLEVSSRRPPVLLS
uniref:Uncharacterized protein n=1 Tax=Oryza meridionalis TaxID=40149 RepID=A0A0E0C570_9ORYZ